MKKFGKLAVVVTSVMLVGCADSNKDNKREVSVGYNIFPIAFADSNSDGVGDINGIIAKLDYIKSLEVDTIWLNPIHESPSYHKYDVVDYYSIDNEFGSMEDFERLLEEAHKRDMNVIIDLVINHTSSQHPWFKEAVADENSEYRDYYTFYDFKDGFNTYSTKDGWAKLNEDTYYFASFWEEMPELNYSNPKVTEEVYAIADFWLLKGVDGFRIDAVKHLYDQREYPKKTPTLKYNVEWFEGFEEHVKGINEDAFIIGEVYDDYVTVNRYYTGFDSLFNFSMADEILSAVKTGNNGKFMSVLQKSYDGMIKQSDTARSAYFISNHDQDRYMTRLDNDLDKAKLASHILFTLPDINFIYYGEEVGMRGEGAHENIREPINWGDEYTTSWEVVKNNKDVATVKEQMEDENSLYNTYKTLGKLKKDNDILKYGTFEAYDMENGLLAYYRVFEDKKLLVVHNISDVDKNLDFGYSVLYTNGYDDSTKVLGSCKTVVLEVK